MSKCYGNVNGWHCANCIRGRTCWSVAGRSQRATLLTSREGRSSRVGVQRGAEGCRGQRGRADPRSTVISKSFQRRIGVKRGLRDSLQDAACKANEEVDDYAWHPELPRSLTPKPSHVALRCQHAPSGWGCNEKANKNTPCLFAPV